MAGDNVPCTAWQACLHTLLGGWATLGGHNDDLAAVKEMLIEQIMEGGDESMPGLKHTIAKSVLRAHWMVLMPTPEERVALLGQLLPQLQVLVTGATTDGATQAGVSCVAGLLLETLCDYETLCAHLPSLATLMPVVIKLCHGISMQQLRSTPATAVAAASNTDAAKQEGAAHTFGPTYGAAARLCIMYHRVLQSRAHARGSRSVSKTRDMYSLGSLTYGYLSSLCDSSVWLLNDCATFAEDGSAADRVAWLVCGGSPLAWLAETVYGLLAAMYKTTSQFGSGGNDDGGIGVHETGIVLAAEAVAPCKAQLVALLAAMRPFACGGDAGLRAPNLSSRTSDLIIGAHSFDEVCHVGLPLLLARCAVLGALRGTPGREGDAADAADPPYNFTECADLFLGGVVKNSLANPLLPPTLGDTPTWPQLPGTNGPDRLMDSFLLHAQAVDVLIKTGHWQPKFARVIEGLLRAAIKHLRLDAEAAAFVAKTPGEALVMDSSSIPIKELYTFGIRIHNELYRKRCHVGGHELYFAPVMARLAFVLNELEPALPEQTPGANGGAHSHDESSRMGNPGAASGVASPGVDAVDAYFDATPQLTDEFEARRVTTSLNPSAQILGCLQNFVFCGGDHPTCMDDLRRRVKHEGSCLIPNPPVFCPAQTNVF